MCPNSVTLQLSSTALFPQSRHRTNGQATTARRSIPAFHTPAPSGMAPLHLSGNRAKQARMSTLAGKLGLRPGSHHEFHECFPLWEWGFWRSGNVSHVPLCDGGKGDIGWARATPSWVRFPAPGSSFNVTKILFSCEWVLRQHRPTGPSGLPFVPA
jgi:hypothetical protein